MSQTHSTWQMQYELKGKLPKEEQQKQKKEEEPPQKINHVLMTLICNDCNIDRTKCKEAWKDDTCELIAKLK